MESRSENSENIFAAIDIGTNSVRLAVVKVEGEQRLTTLAVHREMVRLGEGEFETNQMLPAAIDRGVLVCAKFAEVARGFGANEIVAFATSAVREAENRDDFIERVREETGVEVRVISGPEEARLIWTGVVSGMELASRSAVLIDIGGGSTEVIVGDSTGHKMLESLKLGSIRLSNRFFDHPNPVSLTDFAKVKAYVQGVALPVIQKVTKLGFDMALGSAGTINTLGDIVSKRTGEAVSGQRTTGFKTSDLREAIHAMCKMTLEERVRVPGMDPNRADIIMGGAAVLLTLLEEFGADRLNVSYRGLRDGILLDHLLKGDEDRTAFEKLSVRKRSILQLASACNYEAQHAAHTAKLCLRLFDELSQLKLHPYDEDEKELLEYAAITHDIGTFLSHTNHQKHAYYLVRNSDLLGFNDTEIDIIANVALYHRKSFPKKNRHPNLRDLGRKELKCVHVLAAILRVAEGMDRGHLAFVKDLKLRRTPRTKGFVLTLLSDEDCQMEIWGVQNNRDLFEFVFGAPLTVEVSRMT